MNIKDKFKMALTNNEVKSFLRGSGQYNIPSRDGFMNDNIIALYSGVFDNYRENPNLNIDKIYQNTLIDMLNGNAMDIMIAFDYIRLHIKAEMSKKAPFELSKEVYISLKNSINKNVEILKNHTSEFSLNLNNSYEYIERMNNYMNNEYGRRML